MRLMTSNRTAWSRMCNADSIAVYNDDDNNNNNNYNNNNNNNYYYNISNTSNTSISDSNKHRNVPDLAISNTAGARVANFPEMKIGTPRSRRRRRRRGLGNGEGVPPSPAD